jgi:gamma-glutamyltranspeptidase/glutathione hydrolase
MNGDLAQTLSAIRSYGANGFYGGPVAQKISAYAVAQAGSVSLAELRAYRTAGSQPGAINVGGNTVYGPSAHVGARAFANELLSRLLDQSGNPLPQDNLAAATAAATKAALDKFAIASLPEDLGATGFAALDDSGQAVACAVTMNGPFGSGHTAAGTGVTLAKAPSSGKAGLSSAFLTPVIATEGASGAVTLAGAGVGGPNGSAAIVYALLRLGSGADLTQPSMVRTTGIAPYDTVNVIACKDAACVALADPGANGLGLSTGR